MEEILLISSMATLIILAAFLSIVLGKLRMPPLIGFLAAGILISNFMNLPEDSHVVVDIFSNLGLIMLMFSIGMEIDIRKLRTQGKFAIIVACVQLPLMVLGGIIGGTLLGFNMLQSICLGAIISGSSTAVVMAVLKSQGNLDRDHIEMLVLVTIMEDIGQVIMLSMLTPLLSGATMDGNALILLILGIAVFMIACFTLGLFIVPRIIDWFYERSNDELISLLCIGALFTLSWAAYSMGLSVAIGAFLMGIIVGTSRPKEAVEHFVEPMKSLFMAMFFISVGMEVSLGSLSDNILLILAFYLLFLVFKSSTVFLGYWVGNGGSRNGFISALGLCAMGEFAFIISKEALTNGVVDQAFYSSVIGAALLSMIVLPFLTSYSDKMYTAMERHTPNFMNRLFTRLNKVRDGVYETLGTLSDMTVSLFTRGLGRTYFNVILIFVFQLMFFFIYDPLTWWLNNNIGVLGEVGWRITVVLLNYALLFVPCSRIISDIRLLIHILNVGRKSDSTTSKALRFYEIMHPAALATALDMAIITLTPNNLPVEHHILILLAILAVVGVYHIWRLKNNMLGPTLPTLPEDPVEQESKHS